MNAVVTTMSPRLLSFLFSSMPCILPSVPVDHELCANDPYSHRRGGGSTRYHGKRRPPYGTHVVECIESAPQSCACRNCREGLPQYKCLQLSKSQRRELQKSA